MGRVNNFSSGPAAIDETVLSKIQSEMLDCRSSGMSILEMNHIERNFFDILSETTGLFKKVLEIDDDHCVFFVTGGGWMNFSMIPVNFLDKGSVCDYADTGVWARFALEEAKKTGTVHICASSKKNNYTSCPIIKKEDLAAHSKYLYICTNNSSYGTRFPKEKIPFDLGVPLIADVTSNILAEKININKFDLAFAAAQKNMGPSGISVVFANKEFLERNKKDNIPRVLSYYDYYSTNSTFSTPPTFSIYMINLNLKRLIETGGIENMEKVNIKKASMLYEYIDKSKLFYNKVSKEDRSLTNVIFTSGDDEIDNNFIRFAAKNGIVNINGYKTIKGIRIGLFNAKTVSQVQALIDCLQKYESTH